MANGKIQLLGEFSAKSADGITLNIHGKREKELLAAIAIEQGRRVSRESLTARIWNRDDFQARKSLNTSLWRLRNSVREAKIDCDNWLETGQNYIRLRESNGPSVDITKINQGLSNYKKNALNLSTLVEIAELVKGTLTPELDTEWVEETRREVQKSSIAILYAVIDQLEFNEKAEPILEFAHQIIQFDPYEEQAWQASIKAHLFLGRTTQAQLCFNNLSEILQRDLGIEPSDETTSLFHFVPECNVSGSETTAIFKPQAKALATRINNLNHSLMLVIAELNNIESELKKNI